VDMRRNGSSLPQRDQPNVSPAMCALIPCSRRRIRRARGASVTFEPGARSAWHTHPLSQILIVTAGTGWVQQEVGKSKRSSQAMSYGHLQ